MLIEFNNHHRSETFLYDSWWSQMNKIHELCLYFFFRHNLSLYEIYSTLENLFLILHILDARCQCQWMNNRYIHCQSLLWWYIHYRVLKYITMIDLSLKRLFSKLNTSIFNTLTSRSLFIASLMKTTFFSSFVRSSSQHRYSFIHSFFVRNCWDSSFFYIDDSYEKKDQISHSCSN
jgi:hypothetical protein